MWCLYEYLTLIVNFLRYLQSRQCFSVFMMQISVQIFVQINSWLPTTMLVIFHLLDDEKPSEGKSNVQKLLVCFGGMDTAGQIFDDLFAIAAEWSQLTLSTSTGFVYSKIVFPPTIYFPLDISNSNLPTLLDFLPHHPPGFFPFHVPFPSQSPLIDHCSITSLSVVTSFDDVYGREKWSKRSLIKCTKIIVSRLDADVCLQILWYRSFGASNFALYIKKNGYIIFLIRNDSNYKRFPSLLYRTGWKWWILSPSLPCCTCIYRSRSRSGQKQLERDFQVGPSTLGKRVDQCFVISMTGCYHPLDMQILPDIE